eukprot:3690521-Heterocapsa_arctica.AAC.1
MEVESNQEKRKVRRAEDALEELGENPIFKSARKCLERIEVNCEIANEVKVTGLRQTQMS